MIRIAVLVCVFVALTHGAAVQSVPSAAFQQVYGSYSYYRQNNEDYTKYSFCLANRKTCSHSAFPDFCLAYNTTCTGVQGHTTPSSSSSYGLFLQLCGQWCQACATSYSSCPASATPKRSPAAATPADKCEYSRLQSRMSRISGINTASVPCANPWLVAFKEGPGARPILCSGIIISATKVLTTNECFTRLFALSNFVGTIEEHSWSVIEPNEENLQISYFSRADPKTGLVSMILSQALHFDHCKAPACLEYQDRTIITNLFRCKIVGWGQSNGRVPGELRRGNVSLEGDCANTLVTFMNFLPNLIDMTSVSHSHNIGCTSNSRSQAAACDGDTGGPITCIEARTGETIVVGIIKAGTCGNSNLHTTFFVDLSTTDSKQVLNAL